MTKQELREISKEIDHISKRLSWLDSNNIIESQERRRLFRRWDFLDYQLDQALISAGKTTFCIVNKGNIVAKPSFSDNHLSSQPEKEEHNKSTKAKYKLCIVH